MYQQLTIVGNVGRDPELRYTPSGQAVCDFTVAVNKRYTTQGGEQREETTWFRVTCWRQLAETVSKFLKKGRQVMVIGEVAVNAYTDKAGQPAATLEVTAQTVKFLGSREEGENGGREEYEEFRPPQQQQSGRGRGRNNNPPENTDDIPF